MLHHSISEEYTPEHVYIITTVKCPGVPGSTNHIEHEHLRVPAAEMFKHNQGAYIQDALTSLTPGQRDRLIHGYCESCYDKMFEAEEDEFEEED